MKKIKLIITINLLFMATAVLPVFASNDKTYWVSNITVPAFQQWQLADINDNSYGAYLFLHLDKTGNVIDVVDYRGVNNNNQAITTIGEVKEGVTGNVRVNYTDGNNQTGRFLHGIQVRSHNFNAGSYSINGKLIY